jgi:hypothetical protein
MHCQLVQRLKGSGPKDSSAYCINFIEFMAPQIKVPWTGHCKNKSCHCSLIFTVGQAAISKRHQTFEQDLSSRSEHFQFCQYLVADKENL